MSELKNFIFSCSLPTRASLLSSVAGLGRSSRGWEWGSGVDECVSVADSSHQGLHFEMVKVLTAPPEATALQSSPASRFWKLLTVLALVLSRALCPVLSCHLPSSCPWVLNSSFLNCPLMSQQWHTICPCWNTECLSSTLQEGRQ